jgi:FtsH-binding integral membrane protein
MTHEQILSNTRLREQSILRNVYLWMTLGLGLTGVISLGMASNPVMIRAFASNPVLFFGAIIGEFALVIYLSTRLMKMSATAATLGFAGYAALNGLTLSVIFLAYTGQSIAQAFFVAGGTFAGMSLWATVTKRDLSSIGNYLFMGLIGLIIASVVNFFFRSDAFSFLISIVGVVLFLGLTAYDTQMIKRWNQQYGSSIGEADYVKLSIMGALKLYLDFINLFLFFLRIFGRRN